MAEPIRSFEQFIAEAKRLNLTAADLVPALAMRPEFDDCLSKDFKEAKATIMAMPEQEIRALAIAQHIQLQFHEKYGNAMSNANAALRAEQAAPAVQEVEAPSYWCNKCGYKGNDPVTHLRPDGSGQCGYISRRVKPAYGVALPDGGQQHG